jgi:hypothetical protein
MAWDGQDVAAFASQALGTVGTGDFFFRIFDSGHLLQFNIAIENGHL